MTMTEDDTFRRLIKPSYSQMRKLWAASKFCEEAKQTGILDTKSSEAFFIKYGWTMEEYSWHPNAFKIIHDD